MPEVKIRESLWQEFSALAQRLRRNPKTLAESALRQYIQHIADEELLAASERAGRRSGLRERDVEEVIRQYRRDKAKKVVNGRTEKAGPRRS